MKTIKFCSLQAWKYKLLGLVNVALCYLFFKFINLSVSMREPRVSTLSFIQESAPNVILVCAVVFNALLAFHLLKNKEYKYPFHLYLILTFSTVFWFLLMLLGFFIVSNVIFPLFMLVLVVSTYFLLRRSSHTIAVVLSVATVLVATITVISNFEEDYCWGKGIEADRGGSKMIIATKEDEQAFRGYNVRAGQPAGLGFLTHMRCHNTFRFSDALKDRYLFINYQPVSELLEGRY